MGVMAVSAPRVKKAIPATSITAPALKDTSMLFGMGVMVKQSTSTINVIGSTEETASFVFSRSNFLLSLNSSFPNRKQ